MFSPDAAEPFNDLQICLSPNPIESRYLRKHRFDLFYLNSPHGSICSTLHEIIHFLWFHVWDGLFDDSPDACETCYAVDFERENGSCVYPCFYDMTLDGRPLLDTLYDTKTQ